MKRFPQILFLVTMIASTAPARYAAGAEAQGWASVTNDVAACYSAIRERCAVVGESTNTVSAQYTDPFSDYARMAILIDGIAPRFACSTNIGADGTFSGFMASAGDDGKYPDAPPLWSVSNLHAAAGFTNWATNAVLTSWMVCGPQLQEQVHAAIRLLKYTSHKAGWTNANGFVNRTYSSTHRQEHISDVPAVYPPENDPGWITSRPFYKWPVYNPDQGASVPCPVTARPEVAGVWEDSVSHSLALSYWWTNQQECLDENAAAIAAAEKRLDVDVWFRSSNSAVSASFVVNGLWTGVSHRAQFFYRTREVLPPPALESIKVSMIMDPPRDGKLPMYGIRKSGGCITNDSGGFIMNELTQFNRAASLAGAQPLQMEDLRPANLLSWTNIEVCDVWLDSAAEQNTRYVDSFASSLNVPYDPDAFYENWAAWEYEDQFSADLNGFVRQTRAKGPDGQYGALMLVTQKQYNHSEKGALRRFEWSASAEDPFAVVEWAFNELPVAPSNACVQSADDDLDWISQVGIDMWSLGRDSGGMEWLPREEKPFVFIPVARTPAWYRGIPVNAYFSQGGFDFDPPACSVQGDVDGDGEKQAFSLNTRILESGTSSNAAGMVKRVSMLRPRGQFVVFDFPWDQAAGAFSSEGYPVGIHSNRTYVLRDRTPGFDHDLNYDLLFESGITHRFGVQLTEGWSNQVNSAYGGSWDLAASSFRAFYVPSGALIEIGDAAGRNVRVQDFYAGGYFFWAQYYTVPGCTIDGYWGWDFTNRFVTSASDSRGSVSFIWEEDVPAAALYSTPDGAGGISSALDVDGEGRIRGFFKDGMDDIRSSEAHFDEAAGRIAYTWGSIARTQGEAAGSRQVTLTKTVEGVGEVAARYRYDGWDRLLSAAALLGGESAETQYTYSDEEGRYGNGLLKRSRVTGILAPGGATTAFEYEPQTGWLSAETAPMGNGLSRAVRYFYGNNGLADTGDAADPSALAERPRRVESQFDGAVLSMRLYSYQGIQSVEMQVCTNLASAWGSVGNLCYTNIFRTDGMYEGLPVSASAPAGSEHYSLLIDGSRLHVAESNSNGRTSCTAINGFGAVERTTVSDNLSGTVLSDAVATLDSMGRTVREDYLDGTWIAASNFCLYGPQLVVGTDGGRKMLTYHPAGWVTREEDIDLEQISERVHDARGLVVRQTVRGGSDEVTTTAGYDVRGRLTEAVGLLGRTAILHEDMPWGVRITTTSPDGASVTDERFFDGSPKASYGSGAAAHLSYQYGVENGLWFEKSIRVGDNGETTEWTKNYVNMFGEVCLTETPAADGADSVRSMVTFDGQGRYSGSIDADGIRRVTEYNGRNEAARSGIDIGGEAGVLDPAALDRLSSFDSVASPEGIRSQTSVYPFPNSGAPSVLSSHQRSLDGRSWTSTYAGRTSSGERSPCAPGGKYETTHRSSSGNVSISKYDKWRLARTETYDRSGRLIDFEQRSYDGLGALKQVSHSREGLITYQYDSCRRLSGIIPADPSKGMTIFSYKPATDLKSAVIETGRRNLFYDYWPNGLLKRESGDTEECYYEYDSQGRRCRMTTRRAGAPVITEWKYNRYTGQLQEKWIAGRKVEDYQYRANGQIKSKTDADGVASTFSYGPAGDLEEVAASDGSFRTVNSVDRLGRVVASADDGGIAESYVRTIDGLLSKVEVAGSGIVSNSAAEYGRGADAEITNISWRVENTASGRYDIARDDFARVTEVGDGGIKASYTYPTNGAMVQGLAVESAGQALLSKSIDWDCTNSRISSIEYSRDGRRVAWYGYEYETNSDRIMRIYREDYTYWEYGYDQSNRLASAAAYGEDGAPVPGTAFGYEYDEIGNITEGGLIGAEGRPWHSFESDDRNAHVVRHWANLVPVRGGAHTNVRVYVNMAQADRFGMDFFAAVPVERADVGLWTNIAVLALASGQAGDLVAVETGRMYIASADEAVRYRPAGMREADSRFYYTWDSRGRLVSAASSDKESCKVQFEYYPDGRRAVKKVFEKWGTYNSAPEWKLARKHEYYYDGWNLIAEVLVTSVRPPSNAIFKTEFNICRTNVYHYTWGLDLAGQRSGEWGQDAGGIGGLLAIREVSASGTNTYLTVSDHQGSIHKVIDASTGAVVEEYSYSPYGEVLSVRSPVSGSRSSVSPFLFQTKYYDQETGLYYYGHRYYDPESGKWLSPDPLQESGGLNLYAFCNNDPVNGVDPLGLAAYFFGGTGNNLDDDGWSNVEILFRAWDNNAGHGEKFYVPGVYSGYAPDGTPYKGLIKRPPISQGGYGASLQARADEMMKKLRTQLAAGDKEVNVFGFSRGSLTALVFLNMIAKEVEKGTDPLFKGITVNQTVLFDNVEHTWNDMPHDLPKNLNYTHQPMHLIAVDEQRDQFFDEDVLNMEGALQIGFRGVHANVGGGYDRDGLAAHSLRFVIQSMNACKMKVFRDASIHRQMQKYGMLENGANKTPTANDEWFYTMGTRVFPEGMFLAPTFHFNRARLKNSMDAHAYKEFDSLDAEKWASGSRYSFGQGWVK